MCPRGPLIQSDQGADHGCRAVRSGPGTGCNQIGALCLGDEVAVWARLGNWLSVYCLSGQPLDPLWGNPAPQGWACAKYLGIGWICP